jgi:hypothetical protein
MSIRTDASFTRHIRPLASAIIVAIACAAYSQPAVAQSIDEFRQTYAVLPSDAVTLEIEVASGDIQILYSRDGEVSINGFARSAAGMKLGGNFFMTVLRVEQHGNHLTLRQISNPAYPDQGIDVVYRIDVPYRTVVTAKVNHGRQTFTGIMGPVSATGARGDIKASYISKGLQARLESGNLEFQVIGEHLEASTRKGNISVERAFQGVSAETEEGDITLVVVGPTTATVRSGNGRIDVSGARGKLTGSTSGGNLHVKAIPHDDWWLTSASGNIHLELPPVAKVELEASTDSGEIQCDRDGSAVPNPASRQIHLKLNEGGPHIEAHTESGRILIR